MSQRHIMCNARHSSSQS